jgi:hypothetical protein
MRIFHKLWSVFDEFGAKGLLYLLTRALDGTPCGVHAYHLVAQPVPDRALLPPGRGKTIVVRPLGRGDPALAGLPLSAGVLDYRFGQGALCLGAFKGDTVIGCLWLCLGPYLEDEVRCRFVPLPAGAASWDFDVYLLPEHRVGFGFARLWDEANSLLRQRGVAWSISRISVLNVKSLAAHDKLGIRTLATAVFLRLGTLQAMFASMPPYLHLSGSATSAPILNLHAPAARRAAEALRADA